MTTALTIYGDPISGNCLKVKWVADYLSIPYRWIDVEVVTGGAKTPEFLALHPEGQVPAVVLPDGRRLAQSNAIIFHLAEGSDLIPTDPYDRAKVLQWMFWEQYSHEPYIAVRRFQIAYLARAPEALDPKLLQRGEAALALMQATLERSPFMACERPTLADVALVAYTRVAHEGGFELGAYPAVRAWITRVEAELKIKG